MWSECDKQYLIRVREREGYTCTVTYLIVCATCAWWVLWVYWSTHSTVCIVKCVFDCVWRWSHTTRLTSRSLMMIIMMMGMWLVLACESECLELAVTDWLALRSTPYDWSGTCAPLLFLVPNPAYPPQYLTEATTLQVSSRAANWVSSLKDEIDADAPPQITNQHILQRKPYIRFVPPIDDRGRFVANSSSAPPPFSPLTHSHTQI